MFDLKTLVRELSDGLSAIYEADGLGFSIEVPLTDDRFQSVSLFAADEGVELLTVVHELDKTSQSTIDKYRTKSKRCKVTLEPEAEGAVYRACVRALVPLRDARQEVIEPLLLEVAKLGDGIERELTGGDVD